MGSQLVLIEDKSWESPGGKLEGCVPRGWDWELDEATRQRGRLGIAQARAVLARATPRSAA